MNLIRIRRGRGITNYLASNSSEEWAWACVMRGYKHEWWREETVRLELAQTLGETKHSLPA